jgi:ABC-type multidrug transport system ATPase subunit
MLYEELSPQENLAFFSRLYGAKHWESRVEELLRAVGLWRRRHEPVSGLSRGYHQRLALARALAHRPEVLLVDEPETGLDVDGLVILGELMLVAPGITVLAATHRVERVDAWADGIVRLERGLVVEDTTGDGTPVLDLAAVGAAS